MKTILLTAFMLITFTAMAQQQFEFTGEISEMVKFSDTGKVMEVFETYNPPKQCKIIVKPGLIYVTINSNSKTYIGTGPGETDSAGNISFFASDNPGGLPSVVFMRSRQGDVLFMYLHNKTQTSTGFILR